jgi:hypothetical protein
VQNPVWDVGRSGDLQEVSSTVSGHYTNFHSVPLNGTLCREKVQR